MNTNVGVKGLIKIIVACSRRSVSKTKCDSKYRYTGEE